MNTMAFRTENCWKVTRDERGGDGGRAREEQSRRKGFAKRRETLTSATNIHVTRSFPEDYRNLERPYRPVTREPMNP